jgi:hypothetical protein
VIPYEGTWSAVYGPAVAGVIAGHEARARRFMIAKDLQSGRTVNPS